MSECVKLENMIKDELKRKCEKAYNKGLNDAWELIKRYIFEFSYNDRKAIFDIGYFEDMIKILTPQEALSKLEAYEKEQNEIKVGDVVEVNGYKFLVTTVANDHINLIDSKGITTWTTSTCKKTGKHIDIQKILDELKEGV